MLLTDLPILFLRRLMVDVAVDLLNELAGGVDAVLLLAVVHHRQLHDSPGELSPPRMNGQKRDGHAHGLRVRLVEAGRS